MSLSLRICLLIFAIVLSVVVTIVLRRGRMPIKYSLLWYFSSIVVLCVAVFPIVLEFVCKLLGFKTISNLVTATMIVILLFLTMSLTIIMAGQNKKIVLLIQEVSTLKSKIDNE